MESADILIIGGGIIGSSIGYNLLNDGFKGKIVVFEKDPTYKLSSSALAAGGVRQQFSNPLNIRLVKYSLNIFENFEERMAVEGEPAHAEFHQRGYMYLLDESNWERLHNNYETQIREGADVERLTPDQMLDIFAEMNLEDIKGANFGPKDGRLDSYSVLQGFIKKGRNLGAKYVYEEVVKIKYGKQKIEGLITEKGKIYNAAVIVNAAGPWAQEVGKLARIHLPVDPTNHNQYICAISQKYKEPLPMIIFPNRAWFMGESESMIITGLRKLDQRAGFVWDWDRNHFYDNVWPALAERVPVFDKLKLVRGYAGLLEKTPDGCCILGEHPELKGLILASGFSGHGVMQAPAAGKLISELIRLGRYDTMDATGFSINRFMNKNFVSIPENMN